MKMKLPKAGWIRIRGIVRSGKMPAQKGASICLEADGRYYVSLLYFCEEKAGGNKEHKAGRWTRFFYERTYVDS